METIKHGVRQIVCNHRRVAVVTEPSCFMSVFAPTSSTGSVANHLTVMCFGIFITTGMISVVGRGHSFISNSKALEARVY